MLDRKKVFYNMKVYYDVYMYFSEFVMFQFYGLCFKNKGRN